MSLQRALLGAVHTQLRQASIEADPENTIVRIRFEYDGDPLPRVLEDCQVVGTEVIADFASPWDIDEQHLSVPYPGTLHSLMHTAYRRAEPDAV
jgi:hypothetical protein